MILSRFIHVALFFSLFGWVVLHCMFYFFFFFVCFTFKWKELAICGRARSLVVMPAPGFLRQMTGLPRTFEVWRLTTQPLPLLGYAVRKPHPRGLPHGRSGRKHHSAKRVEVASPRLVWKDRSRDTQHSSSFEQRAAYWVLGQIFINGVLLKQLHSFI